MPPALVIALERGVKKYYVQNTRWDFGITPTNSLNNREEEGKPLRRSIDRIQAKGRSLQLVFISQKRRVTNSTPQTLKGGSLSLLCHYRAESLRGAS